MRDPVCETQRAGRVVPLLSHRRTEEARRQPFAGVEGKRAHEGVPPLTEARVPLARLHGHGKAF